MDGSKPVFLVWVETRNTKDEIVQYVKRAFEDKKAARKYTKYINDNFPSQHAYNNMVAWIEEAEYTPDSYADLADSPKQPTDSHRTPSSTTSLTWDDVHEMRRLHIAGVKITDLVLRFNVSRNTVSKIVNNRTWRQ